MAPKVDLRNGMPSKGIKRSRVAVICQAYIAFVPRLPLQEPGCGKKKKLNQIGLVRSGLVCFLPELYVIESACNSAESHRVHLQRFSRNSTSRVSRRPPIISYERHILPLLLPVIVMVQAGLWRL